MTSETEIIKRKRDEIESTMEFVNFIVDGRHFSIDVVDIEKFPESYFSVALKEEWRDTQSNTMIINRSNVLFRHIIDFHSFRKIPLPPASISMDKILAIQMEADFYNLPELVEACNDLIVKQYKVYQEVVADVISRNPKWRDFDYRLERGASACWEPICIKDELYNIDSHIWDRKLYKNSNLVVINLAELLSDSSITEHGRCIPADKLDKDFLYEFSKSYDAYGGAAFPHIYHLRPHMDLFIELNRLVLVQTGESLIIPSSTRREDRVGMFVWTLNTTFTGGAVHVHCPNTTFSIHKANQYIAYTKACNMTTSPVLSGTMVVLIGQVMSRGHTNNLFKHKFHQFNTEVVTEIVTEIVDTQSEADSMNGAFIASSSRDNTFYKFKEQRKHTPNTLQGVLNTLTSDSRETKHIIYTLDIDFVRYDDVVICLSRLYSLTQVDPCTLQGGDAVLYRLLTQWRISDDSVLWSRDNSECGSECSGSNSECSGSGSNNVEGSGSNSGEASGSDADDDVDFDDYCVYDVSFVLVALDRTTNSSDTCVDCTANLPWTGQHRAGGTTKLVVPMNATSEVVLDARREHRRCEQREHLLTGLKVTKKMKVNAENA